MRTLMESARAAKAASVLTAQLDTESKNRALRAIAAALVERTEEILDSNGRDMESARARVM